MSRLRPIKEALPMGDAQCSWGQLRIAVNIAEFEFGSAQNEQKTTTLTTIVPMRRSETTPMATPGDKSGTEAEADMCSQKRKIDSGQMAGVAPKIASVGKKSKSSIFARK